MAEQIKVGVDTGEALKQFDAVSQAANDAAKSIGQVSSNPIKVDTGDAVDQLNNVADAADTAAEKLNQVSAKPIKVDASDSVKQLQDMADAVNAFTQEIGKTLGKPVKLLNVADNAAELKKLIDDYQEVIRLSTTVRGPLNQANQGPGNRPATPMQLDQTLRQDRNYMHATMSRLMLHNANTSAKPADVGLSYQELTGRLKPAPDPGEDVNPKQRPAQNDARFSKIAQSAAQGLGSGGVAGGAAASFARGAGQASDSGLGMAGILKGGGMAALAYGAFQVVSSAAGTMSDKMDAGKQENIEVDKFRRSLGGMSDSFDQLRNQSRAVGEQFNLTYEQSRKLTIEFANMAKTNAPGQAAVGIDLAQATGVDESQGVGFMAAMRHSGSLGEKARDAKLLAIQFAEALKRTGSALNAGDLMGAMGSFAATTAQRSLGAANVEGFAGLLSAMVGSGTPGLHGNVGNAANILNRADASFQSGGGMGEASNTLQFMAMEGDKVGLLGIKMRQAAGMMATGDGVFGDKNSQVNTFLGANGGQDMTRFGGKESGLEQVLDMFDRRGVSKETQLLSASNHFKMNPEEMATLMNLRDQGRLSGLTGMFDQYKGTVDPTKLSSHGLMTMADIQKAGNSTGDLVAVRNQMAARENLTDAQKKGLNDAKSISDPKQLQEALVKIANSFEREKNLGEQAQETANKIERDTARMADLLIPAAQDAKGYLAALVEKMAPDTEAGKAILAEKKANILSSEQEKLVSGTSPRTIEGARNDFNNRRSTVLPWLPGSKEKLAEIEKDEIAALGPRMPKPGQVNAEMRKKMRDNDAALARINPAWPVGMTEAQIAQESSFNPKAKADNGPKLGFARGYAQFLDGTRETWGKRTGKKYDPENFDDSLELHRLQMTENLKAEGDVDDALRLYHGGPNKKAWGANNAEYVPKIRDRLEKQAAQPKDAAAPARIPEGNPAQKAAAEANRQAIELSLRPLAVTGNFMLHDQFGRQQSEPIMFTNTVNKPMATGGSPRAN